MKILITGAAGFIGSELCLKLLSSGHTVVGIDNHNDYYNPQLKEDRLARHLNHKNYGHFRFDIVENQKLKDVFQNFGPECVVNLAAQAGVRHSIDHPHSFIDSNIVGFLNILENCKQSKIQHLIFASSSSVYGANSKVPYHVNDNVDHPLSLYAATKKANELMAHCYSQLYDIPSTGLRFFTVYGPWGRPDMALFKFAKSIETGEKLELFNFGNHSRDFTFIDDVIEAIVKVIYKPPVKGEKWDPQIPEPGRSFAPWRLYNVGSNSPVDLKYFVSLVESAFDKKADIQMLPMQMGDVKETFADMESFTKEFNFKPKTSIEEGVEKFAAWYKDYY